MLENCISSSFVGTAVMNVGRKSQGVCALPEVWKEQDGFAHSISGGGRGTGLSSGSQLSTWEKSQPWEAKIGDRKKKIWPAEAFWLKEGKKKPSQPRVPASPPQSDLLKFWPSF